jgi:hypothetical protein
MSACRRRIWLGGRLRECDLPLWHGLRGQNCTYEVVVPEDQVELELKQSQPELTAAERQVDEILRNLSGQ